MPTIMKNSKVLEYLITRIVEALNQKKFVDYCLQTLIEFVKNYFSLLVIEYVNVLASNILPIMKNIKDDNCCMMAM